MSFNFRIIIGEVPEPDFLPIGKIYRPGLVIAVLHPYTSTVHLVHSIKKAITLPEWRQWVAAFKDSKIDPVLSYEDPETHLPEKYWRMAVTSENIPPALRV